MPTIFECLDTYCRAKQICLPCKRDRKRIGREVLKKWRLGQYTENFQYNWSEEPDGKYLVIEYPSFFLPRIQDCIERFYVDLSSRKTRNDFIVKACSSDKGLSRGLEAPPKPLKKGYQRAMMPHKSGLIPPQQPLTKSLQAPSKPHRKGIIALMKDFCIPFLGPVVPFASPYLPPYISINRGIEGANKRLCSGIVALSYPLISPYKAPHLALVRVLEGKSRNNNNSRPNTDNPSSINSY